LSSTSPRRSPLSNSNENPVLAVEPKRLGQGWPANQDETADQADMKDTHDVPRFLFLTHHKIVADRRCATFGKGQSRTAALLGHCRRDARRRLIALDRVRPDTRQIP